MKAISETIIGSLRRLLSRMAQTRIPSAGDAFRVGIGYVVGFCLFHLLSCCVSLAGWGILCDVVG